MWSGPNPILTKTPTISLTSNVNQYQQVLDAEAPREKCPDFTVKYVVELTSGKLNGDGELDPKVIVENILVTNAHHRVSVLADEQRSSLGLVRETDRADVAFVRKPDVITLLRRHGLR